MHHRTNPRQIEFVMLSKCERESRWEKENNENKIPNHLNFICHVTLSLLPLGVLEMGKKQERLAVYTYYIPIYVRVCISIKRIK